MALRRKLNAELTQVADTERAIEALIDKSGTVTVGRKIGRESILQLVRPYRRGLSSNALSKVAKVALSSRLDTSRSLTASSPSPLDRMTKINRLP